MRYTKPMKCKGHGCKYKTLNFGCMSKHGNRCIKKLKWCYRQGFMTKESLEMNIKHLKAEKIKQY